VEMDLFQWKGLTRSDICFYYKNGYNLLGLAMVTQFRLKNVFLNVVLEEKVNYINLGISGSKEHLRCRLKKVLYRLKQDPQTR
jgi:hypothetical protein